MMVLKILAIPFVFLLFAAFVYAPGWFYWAFKLLHDTRPLRVVTGYRQARAMLLALLVTVQCAFKSKLQRAMRYRHDPPLYGLYRAFCI
jgi:hypothetical protein